MPLRMFARLCMLIAVGGVEEVGATVILRQAVHILCNNLEMRAHLSYTTKLTDRRTRC